MVEKVPCVMNRVSAKPYFKPEFNILCDHCLNSIWLDEKVSGVSR